MRVHFIRHGESEFNVARTVQGNGEHLFCKELVDCPLTPRGMEQARELKAKFADDAADYRPTLFVVSPMTRALQTLTELRQQHESLQDVPVIVRVDASEVLVDSCDLGRPGKEVAPSFPFVADQLMNLSDDWYLRFLPWKCDVTEPVEAILPRLFAGETESYENSAKRARILRDWLIEHGKENPNAEIVVICHADIIHDLTGGRRKKAPYLKNCEILTMTGEELLQVNADEDAAEMATSTS